MLNTLKPTFSLVAIVAGLFVLTGCESEKHTSSVADEVSPVSEVTQETIQAKALTSGLEAHGGLATWQSFAALEADMNKGGNEQHFVVDLKSRKNLLSGESYVLGFDGSDAWVSPDLEAFPGNPSFYQGLDFYFFGMPFVFADPGTNHESLGSVDINGEPFDAVKISFDAGTGASSDDYYIAHFDPQTHQMRYLLYTVTYSAQEPNENYYLRAYEEWQEVEGLYLPKKISAYSWDAEKRMVGEKRREIEFSNVKINKQQPDASIFNIPSNAEMAGGE